MRPRTAAGPWYWHDRDPVLASRTALLAAARLERRPSTIDVSYAIGILVVLAGIEILLGARLIRARRRRARGELAAPPSQDELRAAGVFVAAPSQVRAASDPASAPAEVGPASASVPTPIVPAATSRSAPSASISAATARASVSAPTTVSATDLPEPPAIEVARTAAPAPAPAWIKATGPSLAPPPSAPRIATPTAAEPPAAGSGRGLKLARNAILAGIVVLVVLLVASSVIPRSTGRGEVLGTTAGAAASASAGVPTPTPRVPTAAASALRLTITVDDRLAASTAKLRTMALAKADPIAIAAILRSIASDAAWGIDVVGRLGEWPAAASLQAALRAYYVAVAATARDGLGATINSASAYRTAAKKMLALTARLVELRTSSVDLAVANGISLPQP